MTTPEESPIEGIVDTDTFRSHIVGYVENIITRTRNQIHALDPLIEEKEKLLETTLAISAEEILEGGRAALELGLAPRVEQSLSLEDLLTLGENVTTYEEKLRRRKIILDSMPREAYPLLSFLQRVRSSTSTISPQHDLLSIKGVPYEEVPSSLQEVLSSQYEAIQLPGWKSVTIEIGRYSLTLQLNSEFVIDGEDKIGGFHSSGGHLNFLPGDWRLTKIAFDFEHRDADDMPTTRIDRFEDVAASLEQLRDIVLLLERFKDRVKPNLR